MEKEKLIYVEGVVEEVVEIQRICEQGLHSLLVEEEVVEVGMETHSSYCLRAEQRNKWTNEKKDIKIIKTSKGLHQIRNQQKNNK